MDDNTPIWFGEYRGTKLANVPASYLLWWERNNPEPAYAKGKELLAYIARNKDVLIQEAVISRPK